MKRNILLCGAALLAASVLVSCYKDDHQPPMVKEGHPGVDFVVDANKVITDNFLGFGTQYNNNLYTTRTYESDGVSEENVKDLEQKVIELNSHYVRIFFDRKCWSDAASYNPEYWPSFLRVVDLAQRTGSIVNITYWHTTMVEDMPRFAQVIKELIVDRGYTCVQQITIQNEVNGTNNFPKEYYRDVYATFVNSLEELGIRNRALVSLNLC